MISLSSSSSRDSGLFRFPHREDKFGGETWLSPSWDPMLLSLCKSTKRHIRMSNSSIVSQ